MGEGLDLNKTKSTIDRNTLELPFDNIFMIADIHMGVRNDNLTWQENVMSYFYKYFIPLVEEKMDDNSIIAILGDFFDNRQNINIQVINNAIEIINKLSEIMPVVLIVGNHDMYKKRDTTVNSLRLFSSIDNVHIIEHVTTLKSSLPSIKKTITMVPYTGDHLQEAKILKETKDDYAFMHTEFTGMVFDMGREILVGTNTELYTGSRIFSGHIHKRQETDKIIYVGSPYHLRRSDIGNTKGVYNLNLKDQNLKFYPNNFSPIYQKINIKRLLDLPFGSIKKIFSNNYTDILIQDVIQDLYKIDIKSVVECLEDTGYKHIEFIIISTDTNNYDRGIAMGDAGDFNMSLGDIVRNNIKSLPVEDSRKKRINEYSDYYTKLAQNEIDAGFLESFSDK